MAALAKISLTSFLSKSKSFSMNSCNSLAFKAGNLWFLKPSIYIKSMPYVKFLMRNQHNRICRVLLLQRLNLISRNFSVIQQNKSRMMSPSDLSQVHLHKVLCFFHMLLYHILFKVPHNNRLTLDRPKVCLVLNEVDNPAVGLPIKDQILFLIKQLVGFCILRRLKYFIKLDRVSLMIIFYTEQ